jgi:hypothetical protein
LLQQLGELFATYSGCLQDREQQTGLEITVVDRDSDRFPKLWVHKVVMAAAGATLLPALLL